jgi:opacity protein-like surface antigen
MMRPRLLALIVPALLLAAPLPAIAQQKKPVPAAAKPAAPRAPIGVNGFVAFGSMRPSASDSFRAAGLESSATEIGGGGQITNLWRGLFAQGYVSTWDGTGERTFIDDAGNRFPLGIPLDVSMTYVDVTAGWKFTLGRRGFAQRVRPYVGAGVGFANYSESSPFAESGDDIDERFTSTHVLGGVEVSLHRWVGVAADIKFRSIPDAFGDDGIAGALRDDNLGGTSAGVRIIVGR